MLFLVAVELPAVGDAHVVDVSVHHLLVERGKRLVDQLFGHGDLALKEQPADPTQVAALAGAQPFLDAVELEVQSRGHRPRRGRAIGQGRGDRRESRGQGHDESKCPRHET